MNLVTPQAGQGWDRLFMTPEFNGGDVIPEDYRGLMDAALPSLPGAGLLADGQPSVLFTLQASYRADGAKENLVHWCSDGRTPLKDSLDLLDALVALEPGVRFLAFVRRPALVRLLASRGWWLHAHEDNPFMALMVCQGGAAQAAQ